MLLAASVRIRSEATVAAAKCVGTFTVSSTSAAKGARFKTQLSSLDLTPTVFQNKAIEKRYQLSSAIAVTSAVAQVENVALSGSSGTANITGAGGLTKLVTWGTDLTTTAAAFVTSHSAAYTAVGITVTSSTFHIIFTAAVAGVPFTAPVCTNATGSLAGTDSNTTPNTSSGIQNIAAAIAATITADSNALVTATSASNVVTVTAKDASQVVACYGSPDDTGGITAVWAQTVAATLPIGNYDNLKNVEWAKNLDYDRNDWEMPWQGASYQCYYFEANWTGKIGDSDVAGAANETGTSRFRIYVNTVASTLKTAMDALTTNVNV
jgi:hypothetical protein